MAPSASTQSAPPEGDCTHSRRPVGGAQSASKRAGGGMRTDSSIWSSRGTASCTADTDNKWNCPTRTRRDSIGGTGVRNSVNTAESARRIRPSKSSTCHCPKMRN